MFVFQPCHISVASTADPSLLIKSVCPAYSPPTYTSTDATANLTERELLQTFIAGVIFRCGNLTKDP